ncbi:hypothetical protein MM236_16230 [Belliella sp. DSM 107340]|uniref:Glycine zipper n=1 Tax=Belliella calami TaxID=2923436 RepID=A0ABS9USF0_9BACT|nr:hypothetical protein [Belliella calami]MCH7399552.1 hypothetical protein [Belliella calami]
MKRIVLTLGIVCFLVFSCNNEIDDSNIVENEVVENSGIDYSIFTEAYINTTKKQSNSKVYNFGVHENLERDMIVFLDRKYPDKDLISTYDDMIASYKLANPKFKNNIAFSLSETNDLQEEIKSLNLSTESEEFLINLSGAFDQLLYNSSDDYVEEDVMVNITNELDEMTSFVNMSNLIPINEKFILLESLEAYKVNLPLLLSEISSNGIVNGRWLKRLLRQVTTVVVNIAVGVATGAVLGGLTGAIIGGSVGLATGVYMIANNECYAAFCWPSGRMSCQTGNCIF